MTIEIKVAIKAILIVIGLCLVVWMILGLKGDKPPLDPKEPKPAKGKEERDWSRFGRGLWKTIKWLLAITIVFWLIWATWWTRGQGWHEVKTWTDQHRPPAAVDNSPTGRRPVVVHMEEWMFNWKTVDGELISGGLEEASYRMDVIKNDSTVFWADLVNDDGVPIIKLRLIKSDPNMGKLTGTWSDYSGKVSDKLVLVRDGPNSWIGQMYRGGPEHWWSDHPKPLVCTMRRR